MFILINLAIIIRSTAQQHPKEEFPWIVLRQISRWMKHQHTSDLPWWQWRRWCAGRPSSWDRDGPAAWGPPFLPPAGPRQTCRCGPPCSRYLSAWTSLMSPAETDRWVKRGNTNTMEQHTNSVEGVIALAGGQTQTATNICTYTLTDEWGTNSRAWRLCN